MRNEVIFDVETKSFFDEAGTFDASKLGVSIVSAYIRKLNDDYEEVCGEMKSFWEKDFKKMWPHFLEADRIIGFNTINFDVPALSPYSPPGFNKLPHFDILAEVKKVVGRRCSLHSLAKATLDDQKSDDPKNAIIYWNKGDKESLRLLQKYCENDVLLTVKLYDYALKNGVLRFTDYWNNPREAKLDFTYPPQQGLF